MSWNGRLICFGVTLAVSAVLLVLPSYRGETVSTSVNRDVTAREGLHARMVDVDGPRAILVLGFPLLVAFLPVAFRRLTRAAAVVMTLFVLIGSMTVGLFYIPSALLLVWAGWGSPARAS